MKKTFLTALFAGICMLAAAQDYEPTSTWPYVYEQFQEGTIYMQQGTKMIQTVNIHLGKDKLHYIDKGLIKEIIPTDVVLVEIGEDKYICQYGQMYRVVAESPKGLVVEENLGDFTKINETGGAYGSSSTSSATNKLTSIATESQVGQNHMLIWQNRDQGVTLPVKKTLYFKTRKDFIKASAKEVQNWAGAERKDEWKAFTKANKIKWNKPESLITVLDFIVTE